MFKNPPKQNICSRFELSEKLHFIIVYTNNSQKTPCWTQNMIESLIYLNSTVNKKYYYYILNQEAPPSVEKSKVLILLSNFQFSI